MSWEPAVLEEACEALSPAARGELRSMGLGLDRVRGGPGLPRRAVSAPDVLNEATAYAIPSSFSRGLRVELPGASMVFLSGTSAVDENGATPPSSSRSASRRCPRARPSRRAFAVPTC